jgi:CP family cyanate transporter-like MFS transporter
MMGKQAAVSQPNYGLFVLIILIGLNLRPFLVAPGPMIVDIIDDLAMSYGAVSLLTLVPMILMGIGAFIAPGIQAVLGTRRGLLSALTLLALGSALKLLAVNGMTLIVTTAICGAGVAFIQSAIPGIIKEKFSNCIPLLTGLYSGSLMAGGAFGAHVIPLLVDFGYSWRQALAWLALPALITLAGAFRLLPGTPVIRPETRLVLRLLRCPRSWALMGVFGLINGGYTSIIAWLAPYYRSQGWSTGDAAGLIVILTFCQASCAIGIPILARHRIDRRPWFWLTLMLQAAGFFGLAFMPASYPEVWAGVCGAGLGGSFALGLMIALDHIPDPVQAGTLAAIMQGGGFLIAAFPPWLIAIFHDWTGSFQSGWLMHLMFVLTTAVFCFCLNPKRYADVLRFNNVPSTQA